MKYVLNIVCKNPIKVAPSKKFSEHAQQIAADRFAVDLIKAIKPGMTEFHLQCSNPFVNVQGLCRFFEFCPENKHFVSLDFSGNDFNAFKPVIHKLISSIPSSVTVLKLSLHELIQDDFARKIGVICSALPNTIEVLNLSDHKGAEEKLLYKESSVILSEDEVVKMTVEQRKTLVGSLIPRFNHLYFVNKQGCLLDGDKSKAMRLIEPLVRAMQDEQLFGKSL